MSGRIEQLLHLVADLEDFSHDRHVAAKPTEDVELGYEELSFVSAASAAVTADIKNDRDLR